VPCECQLLLLKVRLKLTVSGGRLHCLTMKSIIRCPPSISRYPWWAIAIIVWDNTFFTCTPVTCVMRRHNQNLYQQMTKFTVKFWTCHSQSKHFYTVPCIASKSSAVYNIKCKLGLRSISQFRKNRREILISWWSSSTASVRSLRSLTVIVAPHSAAAAAVWIQLAAHLSDSQVIAIWAA